MRIARLTLSIGAAAGLAFAAGCGGDASPGASPTPQQKTIAIAPDGGGGSPSLSATVAAAAPGSTITLAAGTYRLSDPLDIRKGLTIVGAGMSRTIVQSNQSGATISISADGDVILSGLSIRHVGRASTGDALTVNSGRVTVRRCEFAGGKGFWSDGGAGMRIVSSESVTVKDSTFRDNKEAGIFVDTDARPKLADNTCSKNGDGIMYTGGGGGSATGNRCLDNRENGVELIGGAHPTLRGNTCSGNHAGIACTETSHPTLNDNTCSRNNAGILFWDSARGVASGNTCEQNPWGIEVRDHAHPTLTANTISGSRVGLNYCDGSSGTASRNKVTQSGSALKGGAIQLLAAAHPTLDGNIVTGNPGFGIGYFGHSGGAAVNNRLTGNRIGIQVGAGCKPRLSGNTFSGNSYDTLTP